MRAVIGLLIAAALFFWGRQEETDLSRAIDEGIALTAKANRFYLINHEFRPFQDTYAVATELVLIKSPLGTQVDLTPPLMRALCGEILTALSKMPDATVSRRDIFRLTITFPRFEEGRATGEVYNGQGTTMPVEDSACPNLRDIRQINYATFPGVLREWGLMSLNKLTTDLPGAPDLGAIFVSRTGRTVPPLPFVEGCLAALFEYKEPIQEQADHPDRLAVVFLGRKMSSIESVEGEIGVSQHFSISEGGCVATSDVIRIGPDQ